MTLCSTLPNALRILGLVLFILAFSLSAEAQANEVRVSELPIENLLSHIDMPQDQDDAPDSRTQIMFSIVNDTSEVAFLYFRTEVLEPLAFEVFSDVEPDPVFQSPFRAIEQRSHASQGPVLNSDLIVLAPGERSDFTAMFERPPGPALFPIRVLRQDDLRAEEFRRNLTHGMYFGALMTFVLLLLLAPNFLMNAASNWFAVYLASLALLGMHSHGYGLTYLGIPPDAFFPTLRALQTCLMLSYVIFVLSFLRARRAYPVFWRCACVYIALGLTIAVLEQVLESSEFRTVANLVPIFFLVFGAVGAYLAVRDGLHGSRFLMAAFTLLLVGGVANFVASLPGFAAWNEGIDQATMLLQTTDAMVFAGALLSQMYGLRNARDQAITAQMAEMRRRLDLNTKLMQTEGDLRRARDLAERHRASLAETSHDLRQPIASLRMSLEAAKARSPEIVSDLSAGVEFLDRLLEQSQANTRPAAAQDASVDPDNAVPLQVILLNAQRMFAHEAARKGVELDIVPSSLSIEVAAIDLIRIISNLTANAVRYTQMGRVLIGVRRRDGQAAIEVWDTGPGIPPEDLDRITQPYVRAGGAHHPDGEGLGLAIVKQLVEKNGLKLRVRSIPGRGSVFAVEGLIIIESAETVLTNK